MTLPPRRDNVTAPRPPGPPGPPAAGDARPALPGALPWQLHGKIGQHLVLLPGQMHLGTEVASLRTLLGSCVAITLWHPQRRIGGMCHYLLPQRRRLPGDALDGRYGDEAVQAMVDVIQRLRAQPREFIAHLYGGADTMPAGAGVKFAVGERNIEQGWQLIDQWGFQLEGVDVGEDIPRTVTLRLTDGDVQMKRGQGKLSEHLPQPLQRSLSALPTS